MTLRFSIILGGILLLLSAVPALGIAENGAITLRAENEPLGKILIRLSRQSGYAIHVQPQWVDFPVTADFSRLSLEQAITVIFDRRLNHAVMWNEKEKRVNLMLYPLSPSSKKGTAPKKEKISLSLSREAVPIPPGLDGRDIKFKQASRTTDY